jgi:transposase InsO family protein
MDLVGPKYLSGGLKFYFLNIIDIENHYAGVYPISDKSSQSVAKCLVEFWSNYGMPDYLQMDNELSFRGSNRHPRSLGIVLRLALSLGITPIFIPPAEPWRNGVIEKFNHNMLRYFFSKQKFGSIEQLSEKALDFANFHNENHRYSSQEGKTPSQVKSISQEFILNKEIDLSKRIDLSNGNVIFIRFIRSDRNLNILGTKFKVKQELVYNYVVAILQIESHVLIIKQNHIIHHCFPFLMPVDF